jgi:D-alanyl-D-alanine carboxypeptidase/D-alanyl-D-alanine-endopeptidase (penicillin-binding protein 4)
MGIMRIKRITKITVQTIALCIILSGCKSAYIKKTLTHSSDSLHNHSGFVLYDPVEKKNLISINGDKYFTPASNTKIFTLYAGLKILGDSVPALRWISRNDSLIFWGTGDPSPLYTEVYQNGRVLNFLQSRPEKLYFSSTNFQEKVYGPGWSWDDYQDYYQAERSPFPVYGNVVQVKRNHVNPDYFQSHFESKRNGQWRDRTSNRYYGDVASLSEKFETLIPFITSDSLTLELLSDTLKRDVLQVYDSLPQGAATLYSIQADSIYKVLMKQSDNFIAEQILLMCAQKISDTLKTDIAIMKVKKDFLNDLPDSFEWVDGSGLSRYNQFTPRTIVKLWEKIYELVPQQRLFPLLVTNGKPGTLRSMLSNQPSFIYGKTGSLSNNYCLSGYLITKRNHLLIFSSMNTGFISPTSAIRKNLSKTLQYIYDHY